MVTLRFSDLQQQEKIVALLEIESLQFSQTDKDLFMWPPVLEQMEIITTTLDYQLKPG